MNNYIAMSNDRIGILMNNGDISIIDAADFQKVSSYKWAAKKSSSGCTKYAISVKKKKATRLHRLIIETPIGFLADHINGDGLDNTRKNLRIATHKENCRNRSPLKPESRVSKYKGVCRHRDKWRAQITVDCKPTYIGVYVNEIEAALAYDRMAKIHHGQFSWLNFPDTNHEANQAKES